MKKITRIGWVVKNETPRIGINCYDETYQLENVFSTRGKKDIYTEDEWPPRKVRITVEEIGK